MSTNNSNDNRAWLQIVLALISLVSAVSVAWVAANRVGVETGQQQAFATAALQRETTIADAPTKNSVTQIAVTQIVVTQVAVTQVAVTQVAVTQIVDNNIPTIIASLNTPTIAQSSESTMVPPYPACLLIGDWEAQLPNNKSQLRVQWNNVDKIFEGKTIKPGEAARAYGFSVGELSYTAKLTEEPSIVEEQGKYRSSASSFYWQSSTSDISGWPSADEGKFYNNITFIRINESRLPECRP